MFLLIFIHSIFTLDSSDGQQIIPFPQKNYHLTNDGKSLRAVNSARHMEDLEGDKVVFPVQLTKLQLNGMRVCLKDGLVSSCQNDSDVPELFQIESVFSHVKLKTSDDRCLTLLEHDKETDSFSVNVEQCKEGQENQIWIIGNQVKDEKLSTLKEEKEEKVTST